MTSLSHQHVGGKLAEMRESPVCEHFGGSCPDASASDRQPLTCSCLVRLWPRASLSVSTVAAHGVAGLSEDHVGVAPICISTVKAVCCRREAVPGGPKRCWCPQPLAVMGPVHVCASSLDRAFSWTGVFCSLYPLSLRAISSGAQCLPVVTAVTRRGVLSCRRAQ